MFILLPISHDRLESRRWPWLTIGLVVFNVVALIAFNHVSSNYEREAEGPLRSAILFAGSHPDLKACPAIDALVTPQTLRRIADETPPRVAPTARGRRAVGHRAWRDPVAEAAEQAKNAADEAELDRTKASEQAELDRHCAVVAALLDGLPARTWGWVPKGGSLRGLLTYQFVHGGWLHLISNMWFLWLCGCNLEDRWGARVFGGVYVAAGIGGALLHAALTPTGDVPLVGASGAIAGAMGAFLVVFRSTQIRFFMAFPWFSVRFPFLLRWFTFEARAYVMLPLWVASEITSGLSEKGSGVAHWAHVGGFGLGLAAAFALKASGLDRKLDEAVEASVTTLQDPRIVQAANLTTSGKPVDAIRLLGPLERQLPRSIDVHLELLRAAKAADDPVVELRAYEGLIQRYLDQGMEDPAISVFAEIEGTRRVSEMRPGLRIRIAERLAARLEPERAVRVFATVHEEGLVDLTSVRAAVAEAKVHACLGRKERARELLVAARESPASTPEMAAVIERTMEAI